MIDYLSQAISASVESSFFVLYKNTRQTVISSKSSEREEMKPDIFNNADCMQTPAGIIESATKTTGTNLLTIHRYYSLMRF